MNDLQRTLGRLEGKVDGIEKSVNDIKEFMKIQRSEVEDLKKSAWKSAGIMSTLVSIAILVLSRFIKLGG